MSRGWNSGEHVDEFKAVEHDSQVALKHGVRPRCEINSPDDAQYYIDLGVRTLPGDELRSHGLLGRQSAAMREIADQQVEARYTLYTQATRIRSPVSVARARCSHLAPHGGGRLTESSAYRAREVFG